MRYNEYDFGSFEGIKEYGEERRFLSAWTQGLPLTETERLHPSRIQISVT